MTTDKNLSEELEGETFEAEAARRVALRDSQKNPITYTIEEVMRKDLADIEFDPDEEDGWE